MLSGLFIVLGALALLWALLAVWQSLRAALGVSDPRTLHVATLSVERSTLLDEKQALLGSIRDLRFDQELGKLSEADHGRLDKQLRRRAREVLRLLDEDVQPYRERADAMIKKHVAKLGPAMPYRDSATTAENPELKAASPAEKVSEQGSERPCAACGALNDADAVFCKKCASRVAQRECGSCQTMNDPDAAFCKRCATRLEDQVEPEEGEGSAPDDSEGDDALEAEAPVDDHGEPDAESPEEDEDEPDHAEVPDGDEPEESGPPPDGDGETQR